jgi:hypothetical protein
MRIEGAKTRLVPFESVARPRLAPTRNVRQAVGGESSASVRQTSQNAET